MKHKLAILTILASSILAGCGTTREPGSALEQAREGVRTAQVDPQVLALAPEELKKAEETLVSANKAWADGGTVATVDHLAYMTTQRVTIARETASGKAAQAVTDSAAGERDKARLAMRTNEADVAQQQLAMSQQSSAQKSADLAMANAELAQLKELNAKKTDRGMVVTLGDVLFDSGKAQLLPDSGKNMAKLAAVFKNNPQRRASIEGYTDSMGTDMSNLDLSQRRADAVLAALVSLGVPAQALTTRAHGEGLPVASNDSAAGRQMNRRVEIVFARQDDGATPR